VLLPKFCLETAVLHPESPPLIFSRVKWLIYQKGGPGDGPGWAAPTMARLGGLARRGRWCPPGGPLWYLFAPVFFIYSTKILCEVSAYLELCRIGIPTVLFQVQNSSCRYSSSLCKPCKLWEKRQ
jgi:hypothetical protein